VTSQGTFVRAQRLLTTNAANSANERQLPGEKGDRHGRAKTVPQPVADFRFVMGKVSSLLFGQKCSTAATAVVRFESWKEASGAQIPAQ
jgi:hypothetical protein